MYFFGNIGEENVFYDVLEQKRPFYAIKNKRSKSRKIVKWHFPIFFFKAI